MTQRVSKLLLFTALLLLFATAWPAAAYTGSVSVETVDALPGDQVPVQVWLDNNDVEIAGIDIPLQWTGSELKLDSVSFVGSIESGTISATAAFEASSQEVRILYLPSISQLPLEPISAVSGKLATLWFSVSPSAVPQTLPVDSVNDFLSLGGGVELWTRIEIVDTTGINFFLPEFNPGGVVVQTPTGIGDDDGLLPLDFALAQNYPNPFNPTTSIQFVLPRASNARLTIFNLLGQEVETLVDGWREAGQHSVEFDASGLPSGVYFYRLSAGSQAETKKMLLLK